MTIQEMKNRVAEIDKLLDNDSLSDAEYYTLEEEARTLTLEYGKLETQATFASVPVVKCNDWAKNFLASFKANRTQKISLRQYEVFKSIGKGTAFQFDGCRYDYCMQTPVFGCLVKTKI